MSDEKKPIFDFKKLSDIVEKVVISKKRLDLPWRFLWVKSNSNYPSSHGHHILSEYLKHNRQLAANHHMYFKIKDELLKDVQAYCCNGELVSFRLIPWEKTVAVWASDRAMIAQPLVAQLEIIDVPVEFL